MRFKAPVEQTTFNSKYSSAGKCSDAWSTEREHHYDSMKGLGLYDPFHF